MGAGLRSFASTAVLVESARRLPVGRDELQDPVAFDLGQHAVHRVASGLTCGRESSSA